MNLSIVKCYEHTNVVEIQIQNKSMTRHFKVSNEAMKPKNFVSMLKMLRNERRYKIIVACR